jgi:hypothetical protein
MAQRKDTALFAEFISDNVTYMPREAEVLLPFKRPMYTAPSDRSQGPAPKRPRAEAVPSETGISFSVLLSCILGIHVSQEQRPH